MAIINSFKDLIVYQKSYQYSMQIFELSKEFPKEEIYSLTDQIRRSSRSVSANISEAWAKKIYLRAFVSKLTDALGEEYETEVWLDYSFDCKYLSKEEYDNLCSGYTEVRKILISMINEPGKFCKPVF